MCIHLFRIILFSLIQLVYRIKSRLAQPDCCCGYTLDQAAALESYVKHWQSTLPVLLQHSSVEDPRDGQSPNLTAIDKVLLAQTCELAVVANLLIVRIYAPFLRKQTPTGSEPPYNPPALLATLHACQAITQAMGDLCGAYSPPESRQGGKDHRRSEILPSLFDIYPPEKVVFDSAIICAHTAFISKRGVSTFDTTNLTESVTAALGLLANAPLATANRKIVDALKARISAYGGAGLKRKHSQVDISSTCNVKCAIILLLLTQISIHHGPCTSSHNR